MNFENLHLHPSIITGVNELGYTKLTPIQIKSIPTILQGRDVIGIAQTGTGKTAAFVLPILQYLMKTPRRQVGAVIIAPTRELAEQTNVTINKLANHTGLKSIAVYGGTDMKKQIIELGFGVEICVACPGRLLDHIWGGSINLSHLQILVIDEADRMFDMGFLPDIRMILKCLLGKRQTLLFSATMPADIRHLVKEILRNPVTVQIGHTAPAVTVSHSFYPVKQHLKISLLKEILYQLESKSILVFTRTRHRAERITQHLKRAGFRATSLQGDLSQSRRKAALDGFRAGSVRVLVATDIASRGIDVLRISHVINYDMPENTDTYIHRIGRTGRVNMSGNALTLVTSDDTAMVNSVEHILQKKVERRTLKNFDYTLPAPERSDNYQNHRSTRRPVTRKRMTAFANKK